MVDLGVLRCRRLGMFVFFTLYYTRICLAEMSALHKIVLFVSITRFVGDKPNDAKV